MRRIGIFLRSVALPVCVALLLGDVQGDWALPQRAKSGWVYTQTLLAQNVTSSNIDF
jgi:hypothetical protein